MSGVESVPLTFSNGEAPLSAPLQVQRKLSDFESVTGQLEVGRSGLHAYLLDGRAGHQLRLRVASDAFHAVAFVILVDQPGKAFCKTVPGVAPTAASLLEAPQAPVTLPCDGLYRIVVTSIENQAQRKAVCSGEYRMTLVVDEPSVEPPVDSERGTRFSAWESDAR